MGKTDKKSLVLIDAYSQIFRAFYAIRHLTNQRGEPVNAAFVFTRLLLKIAKSYPGDLGAMLFDCGKVDFRLKLAADYKANRPPMPDDLKRQMPLVKRIAAAFGWPLLQCENYEADDLIGAVVAASGDVEKINIISSDKDLSQLVSERVFLVVPQNGNHGTFEERGRSEVEAKFGVPPELMVDYLALLGDSSDNIAGVPGIGPKSAVELLRSCGSAAGWVDDPQVVAESKFFKKLDGNFELLKRNMALIKLRTDLPESWSDLPQKLSRREPDWQEIRTICQENQFNSIIKELPAVPEHPAVVQHEESVEKELDLFAFAEFLPEPKTPEKDDDPSRMVVEQPDLF